MWNTVPLVGVLWRPQFLSSPGSAVALVGCTAFAVMGSQREPYGVIFWFLTARRPLRPVRVRRFLLFVAPGPRGRSLGSCRVGPGTIFGFRRRGGLCGPLVPVGLFPRSIPSRAVALWGHAVSVLGQFLVFPRLRGLLSWLHCVRRMGQFLVFGRFSVALVAPWPPRLRAIFVGGGGRRAALPGAHFPSFLCSGGVRSPGEVGVLGHPGFWRRPGSGLELFARFLGCVEAARRLKHTNWMWLRSPMQERKVLFTFSADVGGSSGGRK